MIKHIILLGFFLIMMQVQAFQNMNAFVYHRFGDDRYPSTNIDIDKFEAHLKYLKENAYEVITMKEVVKRLNKKRDQDAKIAVLTIDDAYKSFYENALPLLQQYDFPATIYVNTKTVGFKDFMSWEELKDAETKGIEIGNHSHAHSYFLNEKIDFFVVDLKESESLFEQNLGNVPKTFAYPYGEWNLDIAYVLDTANYSSAVAQNSGVIGKLSNRFYLPRFPMSNAYAGLDKFIEKLTVKSMQNFEIEVIKSGYMGSPIKPRLILRFAPASYEVRSVQGFIQGAKIRKTLEVIKDGVIKLTMWPDSDLNRRRTLFTVTARDDKGQWHWFSYLYVIPEIVEN